MLRGIRAIATRAGHPDADRAGRAGVALDFANEVHDGGQRALVIAARRRNPPEE
jgi:hypothetical protein